MTCAGELVCGSVAGIAMESPVSLPSACPNGQLRVLTFRHQTRGHCESQWTLW